MSQYSPCPHCQGTTLYMTERLSAGGGYAPNYLPGLAGLWKSAKFDVVVCRSCGLTRWFARPEARQRLGEVGRWKRV